MAILFALKIFDEMTDEPTGETVIFESDNEMTTVIALDGKRACVLTSELLEAAKAVNGIEI